MQAAKQNANEDWWRMEQLHPLRASVQASETGNISCETAYMSPKRACSHTTAAMAAVSVRNTRGPSPP